MGRKRPAQRPEHAGRAADLYNAVEAVRYDHQNQRLQAEMADAAVEALMLVCACRPRRPAGTLQEHGCWLRAVARQQLVIMPNPVCIHLCRKVQICWASSAVGPD